MKNEKTFEQLTYALSETMVDYAREQKFSEIRSTTIDICNIVKDSGTKVRFYKSLSGKFCVFGIGCSVIAYIAGYAKCLVDNKKDEEKE